MITHRASSDSPIPDPIATKVLFYMWQHAQKHNFPTVPDICHACGVPFNRPYATQPDEDGEMLYLMVCLDCVRKWTSWHQESGAKQ